ncbi:MAG: DUF350 domain-containing protein [Catalinimonas sp.]
MNQALDTALTALVYLAATFVLFVVGRLVYRLFHPGVHVGRELVEHDNFAFAVAHVGYYVGLLLSIGGAIVGPTRGLVQDLIDIGTYGGLAIVLLNLSILLNDKLILRKFLVRKEILEDRNTGTGVIEGANAVATGLIILGAVSGEGGNWLTALAFWGVGQGVLLLTAVVYNLILPYDLHDHVERDNVAVGIGFAGAIVALGNLIRYALSGDFETWGETLGEVGIEVVLGLLLLPLARLLTDRILLPGRRLTDELINQEKPNEGAALVEAFAYVGGSVLITWCL